MSNSFHAFLGGSLGRVAIKLLTLSFLAGIVMNFLGWTPQNLMQKIMEFLKSLWKTGFITFTNLFHITVMGAVIVVPIFLFLRIFRKK
ncbi:hypothetical protein MCQ_01127 [Candidatus Bartonella washoeensis Sb944nv]|uniref:DUF6460 domain-containing protein n=1 Tax=Candidatus Bartonella washoeensis Sb944nv TaxID=1094563 RepID=J0YUQ7_9HYPH|nr:DUF6460 domain-containing protein [Bartonella washoeensis]EJF78748.1 hypothetical protein MCQ_01127 [Bartonella washoeensis Sb944nv]